MWYFSVECLSRWVFFLQAEDGIRYLVRSRGLGDVYKRQSQMRAATASSDHEPVCRRPGETAATPAAIARIGSCLLYTSDAADERSSVDLGGRRIIKKKHKDDTGGRRVDNNNMTISKKNIMDITIL